MSSSSSFFIIKDLQSSKVISKSHKDKEDKYVSPHSPYGKCEGHMHHASVDAAAAIAATLVAAIGIL